MQSDRATSPRSAIPSTNGVCLADSENAATVCRLGSAVIASAKDVTFALRRRDISKFGFAFFLRRAAVS